MSFLGHQQPQFQIERARRARADVAQQVEMYRVKYEEMQVTAVAAQMEVTSLQLQLEKAQKDLKEKATSIRLLIAQLNKQKALNAKKGEKLEAFQQKLSSIKAAVKRELNKQLQQNNEKELQLMVNSLLHCYNELCNHSISTEDFHSAVDLITSTFSHPHNSHPHTVTPSRVSALFREEERKQLALLPRELRRQRLEEIVNIIGDEEMVKDGNTRSSSPSSPSSPSSSSPVREKEGGKEDSVRREAEEEVVEEEVVEEEEEEEVVVEEEEEEEVEVEVEVKKDGGGVRARRDLEVVVEDLPSPGDVHYRYCSEPQLPSFHHLSPSPLPHPHTHSLPSHARLRHSSPVLSRKPTWFSRPQSGQLDYSDIESQPAVHSRPVHLRQRSKSLDGRLEEDTRRPLDWQCSSPQRYAHQLRRKLGVMEGSIFTGSLPQLTRSSREEDEREDGEEEEEEEGGIYLDPWEIASAIIPRRMSRRMSKRMMRRLNTLLQVQAQPIYLRLIGGTCEEEEREEDKGGRGGGGGGGGRQRRGGGERGVRGGGGRLRDVFLANKVTECSNNGSDCEASSEDWDTGDKVCDEEEEEKEKEEGKGDGEGEGFYATIPDTKRRKEGGGGGGGGGGWWEVGSHGGGGLGRRETEEMLRQISQGSCSCGSGEGIYACIDDLNLTQSLPNPGGTRTQQVHLSARCSSVLRGRSLRLREMTSLDGYELIDTPMAPPIPSWLSRPSPSLRGVGREDMTSTRSLLWQPQPTCHVYHGEQCAISSDEGANSDPDHHSNLYTTTNFVTMEMKPHPLSNLPCRDAGQPPLPRSETHSPGSRVKMVGGGGGGGGKSKTVNIHSTPKTHNSSKLVEHSGYLCKLDSRLRASRRRWFVLKGSELKYYKNREASFGRPRRVINLSSWCKLATGNEFSFKLTTVAQTYHLAAASTKERDEWVSALQATLRTPTDRPAGHCPSAAPNSAPSFEGWAHVTDHTHSPDDHTPSTRRMWCSLEGGRLFLRPTTTAEPLLSLPLSSCSVRRIRDSLMMDNTASSTSLSLQLSIFEEGRAQPILISTEKQEDRDVWFYHLSVASRGIHGNSVDLTPTENLLATIAKEGGASDHPLWQHPVLNVTQGSLTGSLTSLCSAELISRAISLFQNIQLFISTPISHLAPDCHVAALRHTITTCLRHAQLQDEVYCQLLRQLKGHTDPLNYSALQGWYLLSFLLPMFLPRRPRISWYLQAILTYTASSLLPPLSSSALLCQEVMELTRTRGPRKWCPSVFELKSVLSRYSSSLPSPSPSPSFSFSSSSPVSSSSSSSLLTATGLTLPVELPDGTCQEVEVGPFTTVQELLTRLTDSLAMPSVVESGFALMSDWPGIEECAFFLLPFDSKLCDLLSCWMAAMEELSHCSESPRRTIRLSYRNRLFLKHRRGKETEREAVLLAYQISQEVASGRHPVSSTTQGIKMAALMAQVEYGDWKSREEGGGGGGGGGGGAEGCVLAKEALLKFAPSQFTHMVLEHKHSRYQQQLVEEWSLCAGRSSCDCAREYLTMAGTWHLCGASLLLAEDICSRQAVWLAIHEEGVSVLSLKSLEQQTYHHYNQLSAFGADGGHLVVVTSSSTAGDHGHVPHVQQLEKMVLAMPKAKIHQATDLMSTYMYLKLSTASETGLEAAL